MFVFRSFRFTLLIGGSLLLAHCTRDSLNDPTPDPDDDSGMGMDSMPDPTVWTGPVLSFTKSSGASPNDVSNQDRITDNVWITRGNEGGQIFNIAKESRYNKAGSPEGTEWAEGTVENWETLSYRPFRAAVGRPKNVVGNTYVMHLIEDNIYIEVRFTAWSQNQNGGFAYERSTFE